MCTRGMHTKKTIRVSRRLNSFSVLTSSTRGAVSIDPCIVKADGRGIDRGEHGVEEGEGDADAAAD